MKHIDFLRNTIISSAKRRYFYNQKAFKKAKGLLRRYLKGESIDFKMRLCLDDLPPFTQRVLRKIMAIPYGETRSYGWVAEELGIKGARAVGQALKRNPLPVIVPCHRVVKNNGEIGGFSRGIMVKKKLLKIERSHVC